MKKYLYYVVVFGLTMFYSCKPSNSSRVAETITIDKVTTDLAKAVSKYDRLYGFHEGLARVEKDGKFGFIDKLGEEIIPCQFDDADDFGNGVAVVKKGEKNGAINQHGEFVIPCKYDLLYVFKDSTARARLNGKEGLISVSEEIIVPFEYDNCDEYREGLALVKKNGQYGFVDNTGKLVIPCQYEEVYNETGFSEGFAGVKRDGKWGYIDKTGKVVIPFDDSLTGMPFSSGISTICRGGLSIEGGDLTPTYIHTPFEMALINKKGEQVSKWHRGNIRPFEKGYASFSEERGYWWGLIDCNVNVVVPCMFHVIFCFSIEDGLVRVSEGLGKDGLYNINTNSLSVPCTYDDLPFEISEGLMFAKKDGKYGYINSTNETIIPFIYDHADNLSEGLGVVMRYGKYGYVDRYGNDTFSIK